MMFYLYFLIAKNAISIINMVVLFIFLMLLEIYFVGF